MIRLLFSILFFLMWISCSVQAPSAIGSSNYVEVPLSHHGIDFSNDLTSSADLNIIEYLYFNNGGGVAVGDIDNDGLEDILLTANQKPDRLFRNLGGLKFEDISKSAGISDDSTWSTGVSIDDVNSDGLLDIYICKSAPVSSAGTRNLLYINQGNGVFREMAVQYGLAFSGYSTQASFFDYDRDGDLDMYLLNHSVHSVNSYGSIEKRTVPDALSGDRMYENRLNEGVAQFVDVTAESGIYSSALGYGLGLVTSDLDNDGWIDIYVGNDFHDNDFIYLNNGDGTFSESTKELLTHTSQFTMGVDIADIDGDGWNDIFTTDMMPYDPGIFLKSGGNDAEQVVRVKKDFGYLNQYSRNTMQIQNATGQFIEQALMTGTYASDWSWSVLLQDFDNSGTTDIFISNGILNRPNDLDYIQYINTPENRQSETETDADFNSRLIEQMPNLKIPNLLFEQKGYLQFQTPLNAQVGQPNYSNGSAYADFDKDGYLEIVTNNINGTISLLKKNESRSGNFISLDFRGNKNSVARVFVGDQIFSGEYTTTRGYQSSSTHLVHIGIGEYETIDSVQIIWPDGSMQTERQLSINQTHTIDKLSNQKAKVLAVSTPYEFELSVLQIEHKENEHQDLDNEPLMPFKLSSEGPAALYFDFNKDGYDDLFIGGAKNEEISFYLGGKAIPFKKQEIESFVRDKKYEDVDADLIDFNNDGYQDIYVVSGGNEFNELDKNLEDRIYINDRKGGFLRIPISLPHMNGSCVSVVDYNNDGFEDFFVGSRNVPGAYGVAPVSFIIKNVEGQRLEIVGRVRYGMVTDAAWSDFDGDGTQDLCIVHDWDGIKILSVENDTSFIDITDQLGLPDVRGLFNSVEIADFNRDDHPDIVLGNLGLNSSFQMNMDQVISLYLTDIDNNTYLEPFIFNNFFGAPIPFADKMTIKSQVPTIAKAFPTFEAFSQFRSIEDLLTDDQAVVREASVNTLASIILLSSDSGYQTVELPREAQISSINDFLWIDEGPLSESLLYVGNSKSNSHSLGQTNASSGGLLTGLSNDRIDQTSLPIPIGIVSKKILQKDESTFIVINNDDIQFQLKINRNNSD